MKSQKTLGKEMAFPDESEEFNMLREAFEQLAELRDRP